MDEIFGSYFMFLFSAVLLGDLHMYPAGFDSLLQITNCGVMTLFTASILIQRTPTYFHNSLCFPFQTDSFNKQALGYRGILVFLYIYFFLNQAGHTTDD